MQRTFFAFFALFTAAFILMMGGGVLGTFLSLRLAVDGFPETTIGWVMAGFYLGLVIGSFICHHLVEAVGHIRSFSTFAAITVSAVMLQALWIHPLFWWILRLVTGISMTGLYMVMESWLNEYAEPANRGRIFAVYMAISYLGLALSQFFIAFAEIRGHELFFVIAILFSLCMVPVSTTRSISPQLPPVTRFEIFKLFRRAPLGMSGCLVAGLINGSFYTMAPVFGLGTGFSTSQIAWYMSLTIFSGLCLQWPVGTFSDRFDRRAVLSVLGFMVAGISLLLTLAVSRYTFLVFVMTVLYGGPGFSIYPVSVAYAQDQFKPHEIVTVSSALILFYGLGAGIGPPAASGLMRLFGPQSLYLFIGAVGGTFGLLVYIRRRQKPLARPSIVPTIPVPRTSPVAVSLDPRVPMTESEPEYQPGAPGA